MFSTGRITQNEIETLAGGEQRTYRMSKIPMRLEDGAVTHVITIGEDVTESRRAQERLAQSEKLAAIGQLAAGVMHEINNPLATIGVCVDNITRRVEALAPAPESRAAIEEYLALGICVVWVVDLLKKQVHAFQSEGPTRQFSGDQRLVGEPVLGGFSMRVADLFAEPDWWRR